jgi:hypothetical protein
MLKVFAICSVLFACGPGGRRPEDNVDAFACAPGAEGSLDSCGDGADNDCDGLPDCTDPDCSGVGSCPICGMVEHPLGTPLALPDGVSSGTACTMNMQCTGGTPNCVEAECHASYNSKLHFDGFPDNLTFQDVNNLQSVCVTIEHSWLRDMEISLRAPNGQEVQLHKFLGRTGDEIYLGAANDCDDDANPVAGLGDEYCWKPSATQTMLQYADGGGAMTSVSGCDASSHAKLPPGDYAAAGPWNTLMGATLNGDWEIVVTDLWEIDNGYIFKWSIAFDPTLVQDCSGPVIQ